LYIVHPLAETARKHAQTAFGVSAVM
jgi:hypothetical protein